MKYRRLGKTELMVSEIGLGAEWLERQSAENVKQIIDKCADAGINILDCWMSEPNVRSNIGAAIKGNRERWYIQGHVGSTWQDGQYVRTRDLSIVKPAFEDLLTRLGTDYVDLGMIHYIDSEEDWNNCWNNGFIDYVKELKEAGKIRHIGMSSHNPKIAKLAVESGLVEMMLFSINAAFDLAPGSENLEDLYATKEYDESLCNINPERESLYRLCEENDVGLTVMKPYAGGRLFDIDRSPFGVTLTPVQCIHYALTRPAVAAVMTGLETLEHVDAALAYETATDDEKDYATVLANAPKHTFEGQCTYCGHCKPCVQNIDIAMVNKLYDLAVIQDSVPESVRSHYLVLDHHAEECIGCQDCESRCPFHVSIAERMAAAAELFK